jgi:hypothetical protein
MFLSKVLVILAGLFTAVSASADPVAVHGMVLFGNKTTYASHMPMFQSPHDYQFVFKVELANAGPNSTLENFSKLKNAGNNFFTLAPQAMDLTKVMSGEIKSFKSLLFLGHFERGGQNLGSVTVNVSKIIISAKLNTLGLEKHEYLVFGENEEFYAVHRIAGKPSYDSILKVTQPFDKFQIPNCHFRFCDSPTSGPISASNEKPLILTAHFDDFDENGDPAQIPFPFKSQVLQHLSPGSNATSSVNEVIYFEQDELSH